MSIALRLFIVSYPIYITAGAAVTAGAAADLYVNKEQINYAMLSMSLL